MSKKASIKCASNARTKEIICSKLDFFVKTLEVSIKIVYYMPIEANVAKTP